jgi:hypothetical protein
MQSSFATARQRLSELGIDGDKERAGTGATGIARVTYVCGKCAGCMYVSKSSDCLAPALRPRQRSQSGKRSRSNNACFMVIVISAVSMCPLFLWNPADFRLRLKTGLRDRIAKQFVAIAAHSNALPDIRHTASVFSRGNTVANSSSAEWEIALQERTKRDAKRTADAQECYSLIGQAYRGRQQTTKSGLRCQPWAAQTPNKHRYTADKYPDAGLQANYCRNPSADVAPWCYNGEDTEPAYETCAIPLCLQQLQEVAVPPELLSIDIATDTDTETDTDTGTDIDTDTDTDTDAKTSTDADTHTDADISTNADTPTRTITRPPLSRPEPSGLATGMLTNAHVCSRMLTYASLAS